MKRIWTLRSTIYNNFRHSWKKRGSWGWEWWWEKSWKTSHSHGAKWTMKLRQSRLLESTIPHLFIVRLTVWQDWELTCQENSLSSTDLVVMNLDNQIHLIKTSWRPVRHYFTNPRKINPNTTIPHTTKDKFKVQPNLNYFLSNDQRLSFFLKECDLK